MAETERKVTAYYNTTNTATVLSTSFLLQGLTVMNGSGAAATVGFDGGWGGPVTLPFGTGVSHIPFYNGRLPSLALTSSHTNMVCLVHYTPSV